MSQGEAGYLTKEWVSGIFKGFGGSEQNTGSVEGQIALCTGRINHISEHLKENGKDHSSRRALLKMVGRRKRMLQYLSRRDLDAYRQLIDKLKIRR